MKKFTKKDLKRCDLIPVDEEAPKLIPGVPIHFNYGVYFDDDYDYMQHLKSASDYDNGKLYTISIIPENSFPESKSTEELQIPLTNPPVDEKDETIIDGLNLDSDAESYLSELEDNFVELAGGHAIKDEGSEEENSEEPPRCHDIPEITRKSSLSNLSKDKVAMMERFLYGTIEKESKQEFEKPQINKLTDSESDEETQLNRDFEKLLLQFKNRSSCALSMTSGTSMMSEGLQYALNRDSIITSQRKPQYRDVEKLKPDLKSIIINNMSNTNSFEDKERSEEESLTDDSSGDEDIDSCSKSTFSTANYHLLKMPSCKKSAKQNNVTVNRDEQNESNSSAQYVKKTIDPELLVRKKVETAEERHKRKAAIKQHRQLRRQIRKANQLNFRHEKERQARLSGPTITIH